MYVRKNWMCEDCNKWWAGIAKQYDGGTFSFIVNDVHTETGSAGHKIPLYIPPFQRFLKMFLPDTEFKFSQTHTPLGMQPRTWVKDDQTNKYLKKTMIEFNDRSFNYGSHWAQIIDLGSTEMQFKAMSDTNSGENNTSPEHLMLCLIHEFTAHIEKNPAPEHFIKGGQERKHCRVRYEECLNGYVWSNDWLRNPAMLQLLQQIDFGRKALGFTMPKALKYAPIPQIVREKRRLGKPERRRLGKDNPPPGVGFITAQYKFETPMPLIDFEGTIEDLRAGGFKAEQTFNLSGGDSIKTIQSKKHPGFSAWMNENSRLVRFVVRDEKSDSDLTSFKQSLLAALGVKGNPIDLALPEKEEVEGQSPIALLKKAKEMSDAGDYQGKKKILVKLMNDSPDDWSLDQPGGEDGSGKFPGVKHTPTSFQFHMPKNAIPDSIHKTTPTGDEQTKAPQKETPDKKEEAWRPFMGDTLLYMDRWSIIPELVIKPNPPEENKRRLTLDGVMEPSEILFRLAFGFPKVGQQIGPFKIKEVQAERRLRVKNKMYDFPWTVVADVEGRTSDKEIEKHFDRLMKNREVLPASLGTTYMCELGFTDYEVTKANRLYITGLGKAERIMTNPAELDADGKLYIKDFSPISDKAVSRKFRTEKLEGEVGSDDFLRQIYSKCQLFGEAAGWVLPTNEMKWKRGHPLLNETRIDGFVVPKAISYWHTHPKAFEPSQTSPDDFLIYHGLFTLNGMKDFFTVMSDRIDHFKFQKKNAIDPELMAEGIMDFEDDVRNVFESAMEEYQTKLKANEPLDTEAQTRLIVKKLNKLIPEFHCTFNCYKMDANTIMKNA